MGPFFFALPILGLLRVDPIEEATGMDESRHKGSVYDDSGVPSEAAKDALANSRHSTNKQDLDKKMSSLNGSLNGSRHKYNQVMDASGHEGFLKTQLPKSRRLLSRYNVLTTFRLLIFYN